MAMWKLKGCPRCGGDVFYDTADRRRWYMHCLQCGYSRETGTPAQSSLDRAANRGGMPRADAKDRHTACCG